VAVDSLAAVVELEDFDLQSQPLVVVVHWKLH
jgi:hypothetical protein